MSYHQSMGENQDSDGQKCMRSGGKVKPKTDGSFHYCYYPAGTAFPPSGALRKIDEDEVSDAANNTWLYNRADGSWDFVSHTGNIMSQNVAAPPGGAEVLAGKSASKNSGSSSSECPPNPARTGQGQKGAAVRCWQQFLISKGFNVGPAGADGDHGEKTETASKAYEAGLSAVEKTRTVIPSTMNQTVSGSGTKTVLYVGAASLALVAIALISSSEGSR